MIAEDRVWLMQAAMSGKALQHSEPRLRFQTKRMHQSTFSHAFAVSSRPFLICEAEDQQEGCRQMC